MSRKFHAIGGDDGVRKWFVDRLWELAADLEPFDQPLDELDVFDQDSWFGSHLPSTMGAVVEHARRIQTADLSFPIILGADGRVMDGLHRIARASLEGSATVRAVQFPSDPEPDEVLDWAPMSPSAVVHEQAAAWSRGDLEGYLAPVHAEVLYQNGTLVLRGLDALRKHYEGRTGGTLKVEVLEEVVTGESAVLIVRAALEDWSGMALLSFVRIDGSWLLTGDCTTPH